VKTLCVNARFRRGPQTGVQRVAAELLARLDLPLREVAPQRMTSGIKGHAWEQAVLPFRTGGAPLWSPCNTGPVLVRDQVVTLHDAAVFDYPEWFSGGFVRTYRALWPRLARAVRRVVTVSEFSRARLSVALDLAPSRIEVVPNGVAERFAPSSEAQLQAAAARYGVTSGRYFATLSTVEPRKNLDLVLAAWAQARAHLPGDFRLLLLGGAGAAHIFAGHQINAESESIVRSGFVADADLPALLGGAVALLYPSRYEGFGLPPLEAMACGTPAVVTRAASLPEVCGAAALYVDPDDAGALAMHMRRLASEPALRADLSAVGMERAATFGWTRAAAQMRDILVRDLRL
jgi:glycosyltransferase involved in cell wall biosynthesis